MHQDLLREITEEEIATFDADGIVLLKGMFDSDWVSHVRKAVARDMANPSIMEKDINRGGTGNFFVDTFVWAHVPEFRTVIADSPAAKIAATIMRSAKVNLLFDQILAKDPETSTPTRWHHDVPYWPIDGDQVCTIWLALDRVTAASGAVEYVRGSHKWGQRFKAESFSDNEQYQEDLPAVPDVDNMRDEFDLIRPELEPGDCTVHHGLTVHGAPGNRTRTRRRRAYVMRWCGDDVTYYPRPGIQKMLYTPDIAPGGPLDCDLWPVVWPRPERLAAPVPPQVG